MAAVTLGHGAIGLTVHYVSTTGKHWMANVVEINSDGTVYLKLSTPGRIQYAKAVKQDQETKKVGTWHLIERD
jgi:hypothetical protein